MASQKKKSRRRSSTKKPRSPLTFFVDADLGKGFYEAIRRDDRFLAEFHDNHFDPGTDDDVWISSMAAWGWIAISHDGKIRSHHRSIVRAAHARIIVAAGDWTPAQHAENFLMTFAKVERFVRKHPGPYMARLRQPPPRDRQRKLRPVGDIVLWADFGSDSG